MTYFNCIRIPSSPGGIPARNARGERLLLFLGIIDILQSYRLKKKLEHTWKSMIHDGVSSIQTIFLLSYWRSSMANIISFCNYWRGN